MNATEFLMGKGLLPSEKTRIVLSNEKGVDQDIAILLDEYHAIQSGQKIDLDKKFENLIDKHEVEQKKINEL